MQSSYGSINTACCVPRCSSSKILEKNLMLPTQPEVLGQVLILLPNLLPLSHHAGGIPNSTREKKKKLNTDFASKDSQNLVHLKVSNWISTLKCCRWTFDFQFSSTYPYKDVWKLIKKHDAAGIPTLENNLRNQLDRVYEMGRSMPKVKDSGDHLLLKVPSRIFGRLRNN